GIVSLRKGSRLLALRAAGDEGNQLEQRIRRGRERNLVAQDFAKRPASHPGGVGCPEQRDDLVDMTELVARENAKGIADDIIEAAAGKIKIDVPGFLFRSRLVEQTPRHQCRSRRIVARPTGLGELR